MKICEKVKYILLVLVENFFHLMKSVENNNLVPDGIGRYQVFDGNFEVDTLSLTFESRFGGLDSNTKLHFL